MHHNWAKAWEPSWFELWLELLFNDPEVTKIQTTRRPINLRAILMLRESERQGTVTTSDGPAVAWLKHSQAFERTRAVLLQPSIERDPRWRLAAPHVKR